MDTGHVSALNAKHAGLEARIRDENARPAPNSLLIAAPKKQKLLLKQEIPHATGLRPAHRAQGQQVPSSCAQLPALA